MKLQSRAVAVAAANILIAAADVGVAGVDRVNVAVVDVVAAGVVRPLAADAQRRRQQLLQRLQLLLVNVRVLDYASGVRAYDDGALAAD